MTFLRTYLRVLGLLAPEARLAVALALANIALALAQFIEPILLGHIVDALSGTLPAAIPAAAATLAESFSEVHELPGRDLMPVVDGAPAR